MQVVEGGCHLQGGWCLFLGNCYFHICLFTNRVLLNLNLPLISHATPNFFDPPEFRLPSIKSIPFEFPPSSQPPVAFSLKKIFLLLFKFLKIYFKKTLFVSLIQTQILCRKDERGKWVSNFNYYWRLTRSLLWAQW